MFRTVYGSTTFRITIQHPEKLFADVQSVEKADGSTKQLSITYEGIYFPFKGEVRQDLK